MRRLWLIAVIVALASPVHAAVLTVMNTNDSGPGSLRDCVEQALPGDMVEFDPSLDGQVIQLQSQITIDKPLVIRGRGPDATVLQGRRFCSDQCWGSRVFEVRADIEVVIHGSTIRGGFAPWGGGIANWGSLVLRSCVIENNMALTGCDDVNCSGCPSNDCGGFASEDWARRGGRGGGVWNVGHLQLINSRVQSNSVWWWGNNCFCHPEPKGAGIWTSGQLEVVDSTIQGNWIWYDGSDVHGIFDLGQLTVVNSTIGCDGSYGNAVYTSGHARIVASEVSGSCTRPCTGACLTGYYVPAIVSAGSMEIDRSTISGSNYGVFGNRWSTVTIRDSTFAGMARCDGCTSVENTILPEPGIDWMLSPLDYHGGTTRTHVPLPGSPAIDAGWCDPGFDQRGVPRPLDGNRDGVWMCDVGAVEYVPYKFKVIRPGGDEIVVPADGE